MAQIIILTGTTYTEETDPRVQRTLGAYRVASALMQNGYSVQVIDYIQYMSVEEIINVISKYLNKETLWVGYSSTFFGVFGSFGFSGLSKLEQRDRMYGLNAKNITHIYKYVRDNSNAKLVYGGAYTLGQRSDDRVDYYVLGYADVSVVHLSDYLSGKTKDLHDVTLLSDGSNLLPDESKLVDSGKYPEPQMNNIKTDWETESFYLLPSEPISLEFARGCIFKCKFCNYPLLGKKKGTYIRDMEEVKDELVKLWEAKGTDTFYITDDTFNDDNDKMEDFHKLFTLLPFKPKFAAFLRADLMDRFPHQADLLLDAGIVGAFFGVESFNHQSARVIGKGLHPDKIKKRLSWIRDKWKNNVNIGAGLIIGLPYDNNQYFKELYDYVTSPDYPVDHTSFNPLFILDPKRGTNPYSSEFTMNPEIYGYSFDERGNWYHDNGLTYDIACDIATQFRSLKHEHDKPGDFQVIAHMALDIPLYDILNMKYNELYAKHNIPNLNKIKIDQYKKLVGAT